MVGTGIAMPDTHRKRGAAVMLAACAVVLFAGGCAAGAGSGAPPAGHPAPLIVRDASNGHTVSVTVGQRLELILASTYWTVQGSSRPRVLGQDGPSRLLARPPGCPTIPGIGCVPIRTDFSALAPGTAVITASRTACGEALRCMPGQEHYSLTVVVRAKA
jgi:hypothetical protein